MPSLRSGTSPLKGIALVGGSAAAAHARQLSHSGAPPRSARPLSQPQPPSIRPSVMPPSFRPFRVPPYALRPCAGWHCAASPRPRACSPCRPLHVLPPCRIPSVLISGGCVCSTARTCAGALRCGFCLALVRLQRCPPLPRCLGRCRWQQPRCSPTAGVSSTRQVSPLHAPN